MPEVHGSEKTGATKFVPLKETMLPTCLVIPVFSLKVEAAGEIGIHGTEDVALHEHVEN